MFEGASSFYRNISGWTFADNADTTGMFTGADTWLSRASRDDTVNTTDGPPGAWVFNPVPGERTRRERSVRALHTAAGPEPPEMIPQPGDTGCTFPANSAALKAAVDNCLAVDPTGVACCSHGADCGAAGTVEMPDWDVSQVTRHERACSRQRILQRGYIAMGHLERHDHVPMFRVPGVQQRYRSWDTSSVTTMYMFNARRSSDIGWDSAHDHGTCSRPAFNQHLSRWDVSSVTTMRRCSTDANAFNTMPVGWDTSKVTDSMNISFCRPHGMRGSRAAATTPSPSGWTRIDNACDASLPPVNGAVGTCTDTLVSGTSCVPTCDAGYVLEGVTSCTDRVLTECCVYPGRHHQGRAQGGGGRVRRRSAVRADHAPLGRLARDGHELLFEGQSQFNVDISQWEMSQVTDRGGYVSGRLQLLPGHLGLDLRRQREHDGDVHGRRHLARASTRERRARHDGWTTGCIGSSTRAWRTNASRTDCARPAHGGGTRAAGDDPALGVDTGCAFPDRAALKTAVDNCLAVDPTGVACCSHGADCGAAGTVEMPTGTCRW